MRRRNFTRFFEAKAYGLHETSNPLFPRKENPKRIWPLLAVISFLAVIIGGLAFAVYGPYLRIESVKVDGAVTLSADDIERVVRDQLSLRNYGFLPNDHRWLFRTQQAKSRLLESFPLEFIDIETSGATARVVIEEDVFMVAFRSGDEVYFLDPTGKVLRAADPIEKATVLVKIGAVPYPEGEGELAALHADMPVLREKNAATHQPGDQIFHEAIIENILVFSDELRVMGIDPTEYISDDVLLPWFTVTSDKEYTILFDATKDVGLQATVLKTVLDEHFATQEDLPGYIDVRFGTRVYVR